MLTYEKIMSGYEEMDVSTTAMTLLLQTFKGASHSFKNVTSIITEEASRFYIISTHPTYVAVMYGNMTVALVRVDTFTPYEPYSMYEMYDTCVVHEDSVREDWLLSGESKAHYVQIYWLSRKTEHGSTCPYDLDTLRNTVYRDYLARCEAQRIEEHKRNVALDCV